MRLLLFMFLGTLIGGVCAAGLGLMFGSGYGPAMQGELIIYGVVGMIAGFFGGLVVHVLTYRPSANVDPSTPAPGLGEGFGGINGGVAGGILLMVVAVLWFVGGIFIANKFYFAPPAMFVVGLISMFRGIASGKY